MTNDRYPIIITWGVNFLLLPLENNSIDSKFSIDILLVISSLDKKWRTGIQNFFKVLYARP